MKYKNAAEILPQALLERIQTYIEGELIYIPKSSSKKEWGEKNGSREYYRKRNREIREQYLRGISIEILSENYGLAHSTIRNIIYES